MPKSFITPLPMISFTVYIHSHTLLMSSCSLQVNQDPTSPTASNPLAVTPPAKEQFEIKMVNDGTPLGIHIVARVENEDGR